MKKKELREFNINIHNLASGEHEFRFKITEALLDFFEQNIVGGGSGDCVVKMQKSETMMSLHFQTDANVELICDVSLKPYTHEIAVENELIIKFGDEEKELSEDVLVIPWDTQQINVAEYLYEFLLLAVPMKRIHPDLEKKERPDLIFVSPGESNGEDDEGSIDPRWEVLKKLK